MIKFKIFDVVIEISFLLICFLTLFLVVYGELALFWCIFSALFHELCHILCLLFFGVKPTSLRFQIGGIVLSKSVEKQLNITSKIIVLSSGCVGNFALFLIFYLVNFKFAMTINLCLLIFNILPHEKLDGGQLLETMLYRCNVVKAFKIVNISSNFVSIFLFVLSLVFIFELKNYSLLFFVAMLNLN